MQSLRGYIRMLQKRCLFELSLNAKSEEYDAEKKEEKTERRKNSTIL